MKDRLLSKEYFPQIVGISALTIALCAAAFSVYGIATLFAGAAISVSVMAGTLEFGKLVATTYLYRYWNLMNRTLKWYLVSAVVILMLITSLGIFGFLSSAYQKSAVEFNLSQSKIESLENQKKFYSDSILSAKARIDTLNNIRVTQEARLNEAQTNAFLSRNPIQLSQLQSQTSEMIKQAADEISTKTTFIENERKSAQAIDEQIADIKINSSSKKDVQTLKYVADRLNWELDRVAFWFMITIIFVFDPLAIALILAYNVALFGNMTSKPEDPTPKSNDPDTSDQGGKALLLDALPKK